MVSFRVSHFPQHVILHSVFFYVRYGVSHPARREIIAARGMMPTIPR
tara:strand:- start:6753 stop:6893 length:141 start_codon:yes stop_codon:yes gene_type:complete